MPPSASAKRPTRRSSAPVNAPFSWPNSSLSIEPRRQRGAVQLDQRTVAPARGVVDRARDQLLAGSRLAEDQHGRVHRRDLLHLGQRRAQARRAADDLLEVVLALDLLAQVGVLLREPVALALGEHALGDVDDDRARVLPVGLGAREALHEHRAAVVLAAQLDLDERLLLPRLLGGERVLHARERLFRRRHQRETVGAGHFVRLRGRASPGTRGSRSGSACRCPRTRSRSAPPRRDRGSGAPTRPVRARCGGAAARPRRAPRRAGRSPVAAAPRAWASCPSARRGRGSRRSGRAAARPDSPRRRSRRSHRSAGNLAATSRGWWQISPCATASHGVPARSYSKFSCSSPVRPVGERAHARGRVGELGHERVRRPEHLAQVSNQGGEELGPDDVRGRLDQPQQDLGVTLRLADALRHHRHDTAQRRSVVTRGVRRGSRSA